MEEKCVQNGWDGDINGVLVISWLFFSILSSRFVWCVCVCVYLMCSFAEVLLVLNLRARIYYGLKSGLSL